MEKTKELNKEYYPFILQVNSRIYNGSEKYKFLKPEGIPSELADIVIRIFDLCGYYKIDLEKIIQEKMNYNSHRKYKHGGKLI